MKNSNVRLSVVIPCRNEEHYIGACLKSVVDNDFNMDTIEILVVDGMSDDKTREIVQSYSKDFPFIRLLDNPHRFTPNALNIGIKEARGEIVVRMDSHTVYPEDYLSKCVHYLLSYNVDNVGGILEVVPRENTRAGRAIAKTYSHYFGSGGAEYKVNKSGELKFVDTVPFGCFRKSLFDQIGYFNENLRRSQDMEFNKRIRNSGGKILLAPDIVCRYLIRSDFKSYIRHNFMDGKWAIYPYIYAKEPVSLRHLLPLIFTTSILALSFMSIFTRKSRYIFMLVFGAYSSLNAWFSIKISCGEREWELVPYCYIAFLSRHFAYGLGSLCAVPKTLLSKGFWKNISDSLALYKALGR